MAVMALYRSGEVTPEQFAPYEAFITSQPVPPGALFHAVAFDDQGLCVVDIWESREAFEAFSAGAINPTLTRYGLPIVPPTVLEVTSLATHDGIDGYKSLVTALEPA